MRTYSFFPGCSSSEDGGARAYGWSTRAVCDVLDIGLVEVEDWNCCGSTPYYAVDNLTACCLSARNLAVAEKKKLDLVTPCSACYVHLNRTNQLLRKYPQLKSRVDEALAAGGLEYHETVKVRHLMEIFVKDVGFDELKSRVRRELSGLKVAPYYGCQIVRPEYGFDHPEFPCSLDELISALGAEPVSFPYKTHCCGSSLIISEEDLALDLTGRILQSAAKNGAECIVTPCPLCQTNLDVYQSRVNKRFKTSFNIPVLFFTQLMGLAFGLSDKDVGLQTNIIRPEKVLAKKS